MKVSSVLSFGVHREHKGGLRSRLAWVFRWLADRVDGYGSYAIYVHSEPSLDDEVVCDALNVGFDRSYELLQEVVHHEGMEQLMRETRPDIYQEDKLWK